MCKCNNESIDHLFLHCPIAMDLQSMVLGLFGVSWVMPQSVVELLALLACQQGRFGRHRNGHIWLIVPRCLMWCLWRERNSRCFEDNERPIPDLKLFFFRTLLDWLATLRNQSFSSFLDFLVIFVDPLYTPYVLGCPFFYINKIYYLSKKNLPCKQPNNQ